LDENEIRKDFTAEERIAIGMALEEREREKARERKARPGLPRSEKFTGQEEKGEALEKVAKAVGIALNTARRNMTPEQLAEVRGHLRNLALELRKAGRTQQEISRLLRIPRQTISRWIKGSNAHVSNISPHVGKSGAPYALGFAHVEGRPPSGHGVDHQLSLLDFAEVKQVLHNLARHPPKEAKVASSGDVMVKQVLHGLSGQSSGIWAAVLRVALGEYPKCRYLRFK
jgi:hypothetical protein